MLGRSVDQSTTVSWISFGAFVLVVIVNVVVVGGVVVVSTLKSIPISTQYFVLGI